MLSYINSTGTIVPVNQPMKVTPSILASQFGSVASCKLASGSTNVERFPSTLSIANSTCVISGIPTTALTSTQFSVQVTFSSGVSATAPVTLTVLQASFQGWTQAQALGGSQPVSQATGLSATFPSVTLGWTAMTINAGTVSSYNVYRSTTSGGQDFTSPVASGITSTTFTDSTISANTTYFYVVRPVSSGFSLSTTEADSEIKVVVPPVNMALVHRWMANQEICAELMGRSYDRNNNYRCSYVGPGNSNGFYDLGHNFLVDTVETGCNWTPPPACGDAINGCLGTGVPSNGVGTDGNTFYSRSLGRCYFKVAGIWNEVESLTNSSQYLSATSNQPGLPTLLTVSQNKSWSICQAQTVPGFSKVKRLPRRKEWLASAAWSSNLSDAAINALENGGNLPSTGYCNSSTIASNGLTFDNNSTPTNLETLSITLSANKGIVRTGSLSTQNCLSRYGIQDLVGNAMEYVSDQLSCDGSSTCTGVISTLDTSNNDLDGFPFNGLVGLNTSYWPLSSSINFNVPLGIPLVAGAPSSYGYLPIGTGSNSFNPQKFHGDQISGYIPSANTSRAMYVGGTTEHGSQAGRFLMISNDTPSFKFTWNSQTGLRCLLEAD